MAHALQVLIDDARPGREKLRRYTRPVETIAAQEASEIAGALRRLAAAVEAGHHAAGYFSYELGYLLEPRLAPLLPAGRRVPLLWFGIFDAPEIIEGARVRGYLDAEIAGRAYAGPLRHEWNEAAYAARFDRVHALIGAGDIYQANLSFRSRFPFRGDARALYRSLRVQSAAAHGAFVDDGTRQVLSLSPELFFDLSASGALTAKPMKGTAPRGPDPQSDVLARHRLQENPKDRAENLMIVDLLRNDLGRIAEIGSVAVHDLFAVETYPTLHTMVSTVSAQMKPGTGIRELLHAIFPCGSITGAPKIRAMEIIRELEESPRGIYCGAIGHFAPDGSARFNVAIRTITIEEDRGELGIGGAVVQDSAAASEYAECILKARYFETARRPLELIETLGWSPADGFARRERHLARMAQSAAAFGIAFDRGAALAALQAARGDGDLRVRLTLDETGRFACTAVPLGPPARSWRYAISPLRTLSTDELARHKTNWRELYEDEHARLARLTGCDEVIFLNERGALAEGARTNIFLRLAGRLVTPPLSAGILDGCLRRELIDKGECAERALTPADLDRADEVLLGNSLRGLIRAVPAAPVRAVAE